MKSLLRSVFIGDSADSPELLLRNFQMLNSSALGFDVPEYNAIWGYIQEFVRAHSHIPNVTTLRSHFEHSKEDSVLDQLKHLEGLTARTKGDFQRVLEDKANDRRQRQWSETLKEAAIITSTGMEVVEGKDKKILKGPVQSARYCMERAHDIVAPTIGGRQSGEVTSDGAAVKEEYDRVESDPLAGIGQFTFLDQMDKALSGAKRHELWIHAAFTGGMKSTFMLNWAYNQAVIFQHNTLMFSLEMPYSQCRRILYAIHSMHPKFRAIRLRLGLQQDEKADVGLPYTEIRDGKLKEWNDNAKSFYFDYVIPDFNGEDVVQHPYLGCDYGKIHIEVADPDKDDFTMHDLRSMAEVIYSKDPFASIFVDHCGLMSPRRHRQSTTENLNEVIRDLKKLALGFNRGQGMAVIGLFQISREGYKSALKAKEKTGKAGYNLTHLSYANEAERSADVVTSTWIDEEFQKQSRVQFDNLKSRDQKPFEPFIARVEWPCRKLISCFDAAMTPEENAKMGAAIDKAGSELEDD
jgi:replicative DNA helicase